MGEFSPCRPWARTTSAVWPLASPDEQGIRPRPTRSDLRHLEALVVVRRHLIHEVDFPGQVGAHGALAVATALAGRQPDIVRRIGHAIGPLRQGIARLSPST